MTPKIDIGVEAGETLAMLHRREEIEDAALGDDSIVRRLLATSFNIQYPTDDLIRRVFAAALEPVAVSPPAPEVSDDRQAVINAGILKAWKAASAWPDAKIGETIGISRAMVQMTINGKVREKLFVEELYAIRDTALEQHAALWAVALMIDKVIEEM